MPNFKITHLRLSFAAIIPGGLICLASWFPFFPNADSKQMKKMIAHEISLWL